MRYTRVPRNVNKNRQRPLYRRYRSRPLMRRCLRNRPALEAQPPRTAGVQYAVPPDSHAMTQSDRPRRARGAQRNPANAQNIGFEASPKGESRPCSKLTIFTGSHLVGGRCDARTGSRETSTRNQLFQLSVPVITGPRALCKCLTYKINLPAPPFWEQE